MQYKLKTLAVEAVTFDELVEYGKTHGANMINRMPLSFNYYGAPVTHENDQCYLIKTHTATYRFTPSDMLILSWTGQGPQVTMMNASIFNGMYEKV